MKGCEDVISMPTCTCAHAHACVHACVCEDFSLLDKLTSKS